MRDKRPRLRSFEDATIHVARYVVSNPVRAGLVASVRDYPFIGSPELGLAAVLSSVT